MVHQVSWRPDPRASRSESGKTLVPLLSVLVVLAMGVAGVAIYLQVQERDRRQAKERELHLALAENDDLKVRLQDLQQTKSRIEEDLTRAKKELTLAQDELAKSRQAQEELARSVEGREQEIARLAEDLEQVRGELTAKVTELQGERDAAAQHVAELERAKSELETKVLELAGQPVVELEKVRVSGEPASAVVQASAMLPPSQGQVVVVNREYDFIVVNLGKNQGLSVGQEFQVVRGDEVLGRVKIEKVYDELSAAAILPESKKESIREGDLVKAL